MQQREPLLRVSDLVIDYSSGKTLFHPNRIARPTVTGVSFDIAPGETLGLVGESGSGKSSIARAIVGLTKPAGGEILFQGKDLAQANAAEMRIARRDVQMIFQDPFASLNPRMTVGDLLTEPWRVNRGSLPRNEWGPALAKLMSQVGLDPEHAKRYPAQFSGGQRQRICIARALALRPKLLVCDEAVSALDLSIQAQILNLLKELQEELGLAYLFISHDLGVVRHISDRVAVMYHGKIVETGDCEQVYNRPADEYTRTLLAAEPSLRPWDRQVEVASVV
jgi:ABC-type glutathione transport system ATPase component